MRATQALHQLGQSLNPLGHEGGRVDIRHDLLIANLFAQAEASAFGKTAGEVIAMRSFGLSAPGKGVPV